MKRKSLDIKHISLFLVLTVIVFHISGQKVTLSFHNETVEKVLNSIKHQTGLSLVFCEQYVDLNRKLSVSVDSIPVEHAMKQILKGTNLVFEIKKNKMYLFEKKAVEETKPFTLYEKITGIVSDSLETKIVVFRGENDVRHTNENTFPIAAGPL